MKHIPTFNIMHVKFQQNGRQRLFTIVFSKAFYIILFLRSYSYTIIHNISNNAKTVTAALSIYPWYMFHRYLSYYIHIPYYIKYITARNSKPTRILLHYYIIILKKKAYIYAATAEIPLKKINHKENFQSAEKISCPALAVYGTLKKRQYITSPKVA